MPPPAPRIPPAASAPGVKAGADALPAHPRRQILLHFLGGLPNAPRKRLFDVRFRGSYFRPPFGDALRLLGQGIQLLGLIVLEGFQFLLSFLLLPGKDLPLFFKLLLQRLRRRGAALQIRLLGRKIILPVLQFLLRLLQLLLRRRQRLLAPAQRLIPLLQCLSPPAKFARLILQLLAVMRRLPLGLGKLFLRWPSICSSDSRSRTSSARCRASDSVIDFSRAASSRCPCSRFASSSASCRCAASSSEARCERRFPSASTSPCNF